MSYALLTHNRTKPPKGHPEKKKKTIIKNKKNKKHTNILAII